MSQTMIDKLVEFIRKAAEDDYNVLDRLEDLVYDFSHEQGVELGYIHDELSEVPTNYSKLVTFMNKEFKERFGKTVRKYAEDAYDAQEEASLATLSKEDQKRLHVIGMSLTLGKISPRYVKEYLSYYRSGKGVVVQETESGGMRARLNSDDYEALKMDVDATVAWLESMGFKKVKQPRAPKGRRYGSFSLYD